MECSICLENIDEKEKKKLCCNHVFHEKCIERWSRNNNNGHLCPCCRSQYKNKEVDEIMIECYINNYFLDEILFCSLEEHEDMFGMQSMSDEDFEYFTRFFQLDSSPHTTPEISF